VRKRNNDPTHDMELEYLQQKMLKFEKKYAKNEDFEFSPEELRRFLEEELQLQLRPFSHGDLDRIMEIEGHSFKVEAYPRTRFEEIYREHAEGFYVAEIFGEVIGYVIGPISDDTGELNSLAVDARFRDLGIARRLVELILEGFRAKGIKTCSLKVRTTNEYAVHLYKSIGFHIVKTVESLEPGVDAYLMRMNIQGGNAA
jgi:[ribosomal protein S18]-alanine N-acetyltransferase